ncbi:MAG: hypothetical protein J2P57_12235, partial [Acidimicrobiaceae bacterium]|nr:hypothetical protein [Acidimicrobiaceae bacterium]
MRLPRLAVVAIYAAAFVGLTVMFYFAARWTTGGDSDVATIVLQGQAIDHGNVLLHGWRMLFDSFWTVEVPFYAVGVALFGVDPRLLILVPAACAALTVLVCCRVAIGGRRGWPAAASVVTVVAILALPTGAWAIFFLHGGWHVVTVLWCLIAFVAISRGQWGLRWAVAVVFLAAGLLGDLQTVPLGVVPVFAAGVVLMARRRNWRSGLPAISAAVTGCVLAVVVRLTADAIGTFRIGQINPHATHAQMLQNLRHIPSYAMQAFGTGTRTLGIGGLPAALARIHVVSLVGVLVALVIALVGLIRGMVQGPSGPAKPGAATQGPSGPAKPGAATRGAPHDEVDADWRLDDLLVLGCLGDLAFFVYASLASSQLYLRYLTAFVVFGGLLAARLAGRGMARFTRPSFRRAVAAFAAVVVALYGAGVADSLRKPAPVFTASDLGSYLL